MHYVKCKSLLNLIILEVALHWVSEVRDMRGQKKQKSETGDTYFLFNLTSDYLSDFEDGLLKWLVGLIP